MAETPETPQNKTEAAPNGGDQNPGPSVHALAQFVRDLSFENPLALDMIRDGSATPPEVGLVCNVASNRLEGEVWEVILSMECKAVRGEDVVFLVTLEYSGVFRLVHMPDEHVEPVLMIHCPSLLFPFARAILANVSRDGGYPALLIDMVDFNQLYLSRKQEEAAKGAATGPESANT